MNTKKKTLENKAALGAAWNERLRLRAEAYRLITEGNFLRAEGEKLFTNGAKLWAESNNLYAEGNKLWAEGDKLIAEGEKLWAEAVLKFRGDITMEWVNSTHCILETGEEFKEEKP